MKMRRHMTIFALAGLFTLATGNALSETEAAKAFKRINDDLLTKSRTTDPYTYMDLAEKAMIDFLAKYPKTPEAAQAHFALGRIYASAGESEKAIGHFNGYLSIPVEKGGPNAVAQAKYMIGMSYLALEKYDDAAKALRDVSGAGAQVDARIKQGAAAELERISTLKKLRTGAPALAISAKSFQGKKIKFPEGYRGKVVLLDFWAAWCAPCRVEMLNLIRTYKEFNKNGFEIIGISLDQEKDRFQNYIKESGMEWPQIFDGKYWQSDMAKLYAVNSIPATFLIDKKGIIRYKNLRGENLKAAVMLLLEE